MRSLGQNLGGGARRNMLEDLLTTATDEAWWEADAQLNALERLKMGTTCMFSMMGGNGTRTDDVVFAQTAARELERIGLRTRIGLGPARPPWPRTFTYWRGGTKMERAVSFEEVIDKANRYSTAGAQSLHQRGVKGSLSKALGHGLWAFLRTYV
ncbi:MAG: hypothetical protein V4637_14340, partial [Pseudomonadota bacterium]